jgi:leucyl aminopeptidase
MPKKNNPQSPLFAKIPSLLDTVKTTAPTTARCGFLYVLGQVDETKNKAFITELAPEWQREQLLKTAALKELTQFISAKGPVWILSPKKRTGPVSHSGRLEDSSYSWMRDQVGSLVPLIKHYQIENLYIQAFKAEKDQELGLLAGLEIAAYNYKNCIIENSKSDFPQVYLKATAAVMKQGQCIGRAVNLARHLVNVPPNFLNPQSISEFVQKNFSKKIKLEIWDEKRLEKEGMNLLLGVGRGAEFAPRMIHLKYRPKAKSKKKPIAFVGKGITFDSGGLDIKPSAGMRLMKKDMGGSAAVLGLAQWAVESNYSRPLDFYLAFAENAIDAKSFRPSDVLKARNGMTVEIHNTDAEGRLVMADVLDVAVTQKGADEPETVINVATLTGAIKVALGAEVAGLFCNDDKLADSLNSSGQIAGDLNWRMPLVGKYFSGLNSHFADFANCGDGFGGAIQAALFLEKFVKHKPWAHLDIYAWADRPNGAITSTGGSGQAVQALIEFLKSRA